jgi:signal transduction histidine kinase
MKPAEATIENSAAMGSTTVLHLRFIELAAFLIIVFGARELANFVFPVNTFVTLFLAAIALQIGGQHAIEMLHDRFAFGVEKTERFLLWHSSIVDFLTVSTIVYLTGSVESPFLFVLVIPLFFVCHLFSWRIVTGGYLVGALALFGVIGYLELQGLIPHFNCYLFREETYRNPHYYIGSLLVLGGFLGLVVFLSFTFQKHFRTSISLLRRNDEDTQHKIQELSRLYDISLGINAVMTVETLLKMVAKEVTILLSQPWASIILFNQQGEITHSANVGQNSQNQNNFNGNIKQDGFIEHLRKHKGAIIVENVQLDRRSRAREFPEASGVRSFVGLPLNTGQHVIGAIFVGDFVPKQFEERHVRLLTVMCDQLAIAIAKSKLYETIQRKMQAAERKIQNLEQVNHLKSEYVSHVSHELRTPLTAIKAYVETLQRHIDDGSFKEKRQFLNIVQKESDRLIRIVNDILDVSSIEFGQRPLERSRFSVEEVINEVVTMLQPSLTDKKIRLETIIPDNLPNVDADKDLITQVFVNLINNAVKYSPADTTIRVRAEEKAVDLSIAIEDEGIGIPAAQMEKIFEKYFRVRSDKSRHLDGVGLGLAIVKNIIEQHSGKITVMSEESVGSTFTFTLPKEHYVNDFLGYVDDRITSNSELHEMLSLIVRMIAELLSVKMVSLMLLDKTRSKLFVKVSYGLDQRIAGEIQVKVGEGIAGTVVETGLPLLIDNIEDNAVCVFPNNPQYETTSLLSVPLSLGEVTIGVINVNNKVSGDSFNQDDMNLIVSFGERISKALARLQTAADTQACLQDTVDAFRKLLDRQIQTGNIEQAVDLAVKVARKLNLKEKDVKVIQYVASVHDIGMTAVSDEILNKTFNLTNEEFDEIKRHPVIGAELIRPLEFVELVSNIILHHHERVDGLGYPMGLKQHQIPIGSRILAVVDAYQSMTGERPYREALAVEQAVQELTDCAGRHFDVEIVDCFIGVLADEGKLVGDRAKRFRRSLKQSVPEA